MKYMILLTCGLFLIGLVGCDKPTAPSAGPAESLPADLLVSTPPADAIDVVAAKQAAKEGQPIVVKGFIGGQEEPLAEKRAIFTLADLNLKTCDKTPGDTCKTPWDACCEPKDVVAAHSLSVQVLKGDGTPYHAGLKGVNGIAPHKQVIVSGIARPMSGSNALIVEAKQIYVLP